MSLNGGDMSFDIVPPHLAVKAMRDNGYKNAAYAVAELIDNAIQADATQIEVLCADKTLQRKYRSTTRLNQLAVLDNGSGMSSGELRMALQFGNGAYLDEDKHTGIGRFGMGLPSSSISQCCRVDVWSWQNGIYSALHTYLDLEDVIAGKTKEIPQPQSKALPPLWQIVGDKFENTGTLVVWSTIDRCGWSRSKTLIEHSEHLIGRIYRRFIASELVKIRFVTFDCGQPEEIKEKWAQPNDPLYLMRDTSCPSDPPHILPGEPMFTPWAEIPCRKHTIKYLGQEHQVKIRYAIAKNEARTGANPGSRRHGKHAGKNLGVSIMRAERELDLDPAWTDPSNPRDRWWGVEIDFPPALDDLFGVTNNKQSARYFSDMAKVDLGELTADTDDSDDRQLVLSKIVREIQSNIAIMRKLVEDQKKGETRIRSVKDDHNSPEAKATETTKRRQDEGFFGESDKQQQELTTDKRTKAISDTLFETGAVDSKEEAEELSVKIVDSGFKYDFETARGDRYGDFFEVHRSGGVVLITLNRSHPAYRNLIEALEKSDLSGATEGDLRDRLRRASDGLRLLLIAWARYEDEQARYMPERLGRVIEVRHHWGRMAREFLDVED